MTLAPVRLLAVAAAAAAVAAAGTFLTAGVVVPASNAGTLTSPVDAHALAPAACSSLALTAVVTGTTGTAANELILGTAAGETIKGGGGTDCIVAGGGDDSIVAAGAGSVCIGGPGTDQFASCSTALQ